MDKSTFDLWMALLEKNQDSLFLSNEESSWTYRELKDAVKECDLELELLPPSVCLIEGDYSLKAIAWLLAGLSRGWTMVPVVSLNEDIVRARTRISGARYRVSALSEWHLVATESTGEGFTNESINEQGGVLLFSSGSTGEPKAMLKELNLHLSERDIAKRSPINMGLLLLFDHIGGLNTLISGLKRAVHLVCADKSEPSYNG